jgi:3-oxoacyl-[acyl-carrier-protein] synthase II
MERVVVTGLGAVSVYGLGARNLWDNLTAGRSGLSRAEEVGREAELAKVVGAVRDFDPTAHFEHKAIGRLDRFAQFAVVAAREAFKDSGASLESRDPFRFGVVVGSGIGGLDTFAEQGEIVRTKGPKRVSPLVVPKFMPNAAAGQIAQFLGFRGVNYSVSTACTTGNHAIGRAIDELRLGRADLIIAGGSEAALNLFGLAGMSATRALARGEDPATASRPFDMTRDGFVFSEGAGILVLGINIDQVDTINAHGTATSLNDSMESKAILGLFGDRGRRLPVSGIKSMLGHALGGAGGLEAIASVLTIVEQTLPPTINYHEPDPDCPLDVVPNQARAARIKTVLSNNFAFGGHNACLLFGKLD